MDKTLPTLLIAAAAALVTVLAPVPSQATDEKDRIFEPDKGPDPDRTTAARHALALKEAEKRLRTSLAACDRMQASDRAECVRSAQSVHDSDIARANDFLEEPQ